MDSEKKSFYVAPEVLGVNRLFTMSLLQASSSRETEDGDITATPAEFE